MRIKTAVMYIVFAIFLVIVIGSKRNLHVDEVFSYGLANNGEDTVLNL
jgi:hypothetical protein